jgi:hypothetical protein
MEHDGTDGIPDQEVEVTHRLCGSPSKRRHACGPIGSSVRPLLVVRNSSLNPLSVTNATAVALPDICGTGRNVGSRRAARP